MSEAENERPYDLEDRLVDFGVRVMDVVEALPDTRVGNHVANQLIRCGTSPAPNYGEAQGAESRNDFVHKMRVCLKELRETRIWLRMAQRKGLIKPEDRLIPLMGECEEPISIFYKSIKTAEKNREK